MTKSATTDEPILPLAEAATLASYSYWGLSAAARKGTLETTVHRGRRFVTASALRAFLAGREARRSRPKPKGPRP